MMLTLYPTDIYSMPKGNMWKEKESPIYQPKHAKQKGWQKTKRK